MLGECIKPTAPSSPEKASSGARLNTGFFLAWIGVLLVAVAAVVPNASERSAFLRAASDWTFLRHAGVAPITAVVAIDSGKSAGKRWTLVAFAARDKLRRREACTYVLVGSAHAPRSFDGSCAALGKRSHSLIEFVGDGSGVFGAVSAPAVRLDVIGSTGNVYGLHLIPAPTTLDLPGVRFFAIPAGSLSPATFIARDANGHLLQQTSA